MEFRQIQIGIATAVSIAILCLPAGMSGGQEGRKVEAKGSHPMAFTLTVKGFENGGTIPKLNSCEGGDQSPALEWSHQPDGAQSFALIVDDPDAPAGTWNHWLLWDIPAHVHSIPAGFTPGNVGEIGRAHV